MKKGKAVRKASPVAFERIDRDTMTGVVMYARLDELVAQFHPELEHARIALAWNTAWKPDVDGRVILGKCIKVTALHREFLDVDFIVAIRQSFWCHLLVNDRDRSALLDHELCHAAMKFDSNGEPVVDERGRQVYRTKKHDIEEFSAIVARYGLWTHELAATFGTLRAKDLETPYAPCDACAHSPGWVVAEDGAHVTRCVCWVSWVERRRLYAAEAVPA